jgi:hypothetical protein
MELHSETFNPADFAWRGLTLTPAAAAYPRAGGEKARDPRRTFRR